MRERENERATHLLILIIYTIFTFVLAGESYLLSWDASAVVLLLLGLVACWVLHITEKIPESIRLWLYFILTMLAFFFYGIHETSMYDLAPVMIMVIIMYSVTEKYSIIWLCVATYYLTICYDFVFVLGGSVELTPLTVTRTLLHFVLVYVAGCLAKISIQRYKAERKSTNKVIEELEETNRRTEDFLANVSHELRTPINAVTGITAVMLKNETEADKRKDILSVQKAGHRLFEQIEDILDYTEIDTGRIKVSEDAYMISSVLNDIITGNRLAKREHEPELIFDIDTSIPSVLMGDARKIKKILNHLIDNAYKFTEKGGIYVRVYALHKSYGINLCIKVSDTGIGIAKEELGKITDRFYQSNGGRNRRAGGLGLGLPIVYGMVSAMEGFIQIESAVGKGTTVSVSIPQKVVEDAAGMVVTNRDALCIACFLEPEKHPVPEVRDYYNEMISHMVQGLDIPLHRVSNMDELENLTSRYRLTHLFTGMEEYRENQAYFEAFNQGTEVVVVADDGFALPKGSRIKLLRKPFYSLPVINILNAVSSNEMDSLQEKHMTCPGISVLVVDDEPMNLMVAEGIFKGYQMTVTTAESGRKAIKLCESTDFDLIFLDHMMPEMDGVETLKQLRKIYTDTDKTFTAIAFTANAVSGARELFLSEGFDEFISKPIEMNEMERVLKKVLPKSAILYGQDRDENETKVVAFTEETEEELDSQNILEAEDEKHFSEVNLPEDKIACLEKGGLNTHEGLKYSQGDQEFYFELLMQFAQGYALKESELNEYYKNKDYSNYRIQTHALKSSSKLLGEDSLSEMAKAAEMAADKCDAAYIEAHHEELMTKYREMADCIFKVLDSGKTAIERGER